MISTPVSETVIEETMKLVERRFSLKPKVAIAGFGKAGKSSLFNAIYGEKVASVSMRTDETVKTQVKERFGIDFTDTPGIGTAKFSLDKVQQMGVFDRQHVIVHVLNGASAISSEDEELHELLESSSTTRVTVVNKVDILDEAEQDEYAESVKEKLGLRRHEFLFISAKRGIRVEHLVRRIADVLPDAMQDAFIAQQNADLELKQKRIRALIYSKATACGAIGAIPIPFADILAITPLQVAMVTAIGYFHGIEMTKERSLELIGTVGAGVGLREMGRQLVKLIPIYGQITSAAIAFGGTVALGETANVWFKKKMKVDASELKEVFRKTAEKAKDEYKAHRDKSVEQKVKQLRAKHKSGEMSDEEFAEKLRELDQG